MPTLSNIFRFARPLQLFLGLLTYGLGLGVAHFLGNLLLIETQLSGGLIVLLLLAASNLLTEYFRPFADPLFSGETRREREQLRPTLLIIAAALIAAAALLAFLLRLRGLLPVSPSLLLVVFLLLSLSLAVPPIRLIDRGFGEIITAFQLAVLTPAFGLSLHYPQLHPLLMSFTFPLFLLAVAWLLASSFEQYTESIKYQRRGLLTLLTWQRAIPVHNGLVIAAYLIFAAIPFIGVSFNLVWPALLTLPVAAYQIIVLHNIAGGARPLWSALNVSASVVFGLTAYLITITFWLR